MDPSDDDILDRKATPIMILWFPPPTRIDQQSVIHKWEEKVYRGSVEKVHSARSYLQVDYRDIFKEEVYGVCRNLGRYDFGIEMINSWYTDGMRYTARRWWYGDPLLLYPIVWGITRGVGRRLVWRWEGVQQEEVEGVGMGYNKELVWRWQGVQQEGATIQRKSRALSSSCHPPSLSLYKKIAPHSPHDDAGSLCQR